MVNSQLKGVSDDRSCLLRLDATNAVLARDGEVGKEAREVGVGITSAKYFAGARIVRVFNTMSFRRLASNANRSAERMAIPRALPGPNQR